MTNTSTSTRYERIYIQHWPMILKLCSNILCDYASAKDCAQEAFVSLYKNFKKIDIQDYEKWLRRVARHQCYYFIRTKNRRSILAYEAAAEQQYLYPAFEEPDAVYQVKPPQHDDIVREIKAAMRHLKPSQKKCTELFYFKQLTYRQISDETSMTVRQVKTNLQCARRNLRFHLSPRQKQGFLSLGSD